MERCSVDTGRRLTATDWVVEQHFDTGGHGKTLRDVQAAAIIRERVIRETEKRHGVGGGTLAEFDRKYRTEQLNELGINPISLRRV